MTILFIAYASVLLQVLVERSDYNILEKRYENELYDSNFSIGSETGFAIAAAIVSFPVQSEPIEDPEIGELIFSINGWNTTNSGNY